MLKRTILLYVIVCVLMPLAVSAQTASCRLKTNDVRLNVKVQGLGAKAAKNRTLIQRAIDKSAAHGGGMVVIPQGDWMTGRIELKSGVELRIDSGAVLRFSGEIKDYLPAVFTRDEGVDVMSLGSCIYANGVHDIAVTGKGRIVGPSTECEVYKSMGKRLKTNDVRGKASGDDSITVFLPKTIAPINCKNVRIEDVTLDSCLYWNVVPQYCDSVIIRDVTVNSHGHGRTDGIDVDSSCDVLIENCTLDCQDDCVCMKSGRGEDGLRVNRPTENVEIRNCLMLRGGGGIVTGTETAGGIRNIYCHDCVFRGTDNGIRLKTRRTRGGWTHDVRVEHCKASNLVYNAVKVEMLGSVQWLGDAARRYPAREVNALTPKISDLYIDDYDVDGCKRFVSLEGLPEQKLQNINILNVKIKNCEEFGKMQDVDGIEIK